MTGFAEAARGPFIVGIDAGTSVVKSVAFDLEGRQIAVAARPNRFSTGPHGAAEQDMAQTFADAAATLRDLCERLPGGAAGILAVAVTGQGDGTWLIDGEGGPVCPAWLWLDGRAGEVASRMAGDARHRHHFRTTGTGINPCQQGAQLLEMKWNHRHLLDRATTAFHCKDWLYFSLTGVRASDPSEAVFTFGDFRTRQYDASVIDNLGLADEARLLPPIVDGLTQSHPLGEAAARATGLRAGTPVVLGYVDFVTTAVGGGLVSDGGRAGCSILGSTGMHERFVRRPDDVLLNSEESGYVALLPFEASMAQIQSNMAATLNVDWLLDLARSILRDEGVELGREALVRRLDERVLDAEAMAAIYHPYISTAGERGPFMDPLARAQFVGLHAGVGFYDLMRAVFEGIAFATRDCYSGTGAVPGEVHLTGGAARSRAMRTILASVLGASVRVVEQEEAGAAGVAMIAAVREGIFPDMMAATRSWTAPRLSEATCPDEGLTRLYDEGFELYRDLRKAARPTWERFDAIKRRHAPARLSGLPAKRE